MDNLTEETNKSITRAYAIAFTMEFRGLRIHTDLLSVAQIENLSNHGEVNAVEELYEVALENPAQYETDVKDYLKALKTRVVSVKTYEKKAK